MYEIPQQNQGAMRTELQERGILLSTDKTLTPVFIRRGHARTEILMKFSSTLVIAALLSALTFPVTGAAQVGSSTDIIMGQVLGPDSLPVSGARIEAVSVESGTTRTRTTGADGRYTIVFPDGGGNYRVSVSAIGFTPQAINLQRQADEDRFVGNVRLGRFATVLSAVTVRSTQARPGQNQRPEAGNQERNLSPLIVNRLPVDQSDLNNLAALTPGVIAVAASDTSTASFSVAGQPANQNNITLDGLSFGSGSVPQEGVRNTRVVTATYDVSRGQFTGGQIATTTRAGSNNFQGAVNLSRRDPNLEFSEDTEDGFSPRYTQTQLSLGAGGPIIKDKFFTFASLQLNRRTDPLQSLLVADPLSLQRLGTNTDSVSRFIGLLNGYGLRPTDAFIPDEKVGDNASALVRFDYRLGESNTVMVRGDWRGNVQDASRISALSVPHSGGNAHTSGGGGMVTLTSNWSMYINELRAYESVSNRSSAPYLAAPGGRVVVSSVLNDGSVSVSTLQFGGNTGLPQNARTRYTEISDEVSRLTTTGGHRFKLGGLLNEERSFSGVIPNGLGTFTFNSLADFEAGHASSFTRTLFARDREAKTVNAALYIGDAWRKSADLQLTYGVRLEGTKFGNEPELNPEIQQLFGRRTDQFPGEVHVSPRAGFTYFLRRGEDGPPAVTIRGGFGEFRGRAPAQLFGAASDATGLASGQSQIFCVGSTVPFPDWDAFLASSAAIPTACNGNSSVFGNQRRNVTVVDPAYEAPRAWRSSLGFTRRLVDRYSLAVDASYARGVSQTGALDINLDTVPKFHLGTEANRPVFASPTAIVPATGVVGLTSSRLHPEYGAVSEIMSRLASDTKQLTIGLNGATRRGILLNMSYTLTRSRDQVQGISGGFGGGSSTAGNPNAAEWGTSDLERRHSFLTTVTWPIKPAFELSAVGRLVSGAKFTPIVGGDVNGDGSRNDRAFVYDPSATSDAALATGMSRLLLNGGQRTNDCLRKQFGSIAGRNSCTAPWSPSLDLQANLRPAGFGLNRKVTFSISALNTLTGLDQLLHGSDNLRGWGQPVFPDRTLLYVRGFDPATKSFKYEVNEHFGASSGTRNAFRVPFQIALQARVTLGQDPATQQFRNVLGGGGRGGRATPEELRDRMARAVPNPFRLILEREDSLPATDSTKLNLTAEQKASLVVKRDSLQVKADSLVDALSKLLGDPKNNDPLTMMTQMRPRIEQGRTLARDAIKQAQAILTPAQWARVPASIKSPFQQREGEGGRGFPDR